MEFREKPMQNLIRIKEKEICKNVQALLLDGESIVGAYKTVRDQAVFTSHRIFIVDMQGVTGTRQEIFVLPYRKVLHYGIQTAGFGDPLQASQLTVCFADGHVEARRSPEIPETIDDADNGYFWGSSDENMYLDRTY